MSQQEKTLEELWNEYMVPEQIEGEEVNPLDYKFNVELQKWELIPGWWREQ